MKLQHLGGGIKHYVHITDLEHMEAVDKASYLFLQAGKCGLEKDP